MDNIKTFYHGGVTSDFDIHKLDIFISQNIGFNMFDISNRDKAFNCAYQANIKNETFNNGVIKLNLSSNLNVVTINDISSINRITKTQLMEYKNIGYDIINCKYNDEIYYILINKDKIKSITFEPIINRYTKEQMILSLNKITYTCPIPDIALEYRYEPYYKEFGSVYYISEAICEFYNLISKNDIEKLEQIKEKIEASKGTKMIFPIELENFVNGLNMYINDLLIKKENIDKLFKKEKDVLIKSKLPILKEKIDKINELNDGTVNNHEITNEYNYFHRINKFREEDIERLNRFDNRLNLIIRVLTNGKNKEENQDIGNNIGVSKEQINNIKREINTCSNLINKIINSLKLQKIVGLSKLDNIIFKNRQTDLHQNSEILDDYIEILEAKKQILNELKDMTTVIKAQKVKK